MSLKSSRPTSARGRARFGRPNDVTVPKNIGEAPEERMKIVKFFSTEIPEESEDEGRSPSPGMKKATRKPKTRKSRKIAPPLPPRQPTTPTITKHRPIVSVKVQPDYFTPRSRTPKQDRLPKKRIVAKNEDCDVTADDVGDRYKEYDLDSWVPPSDPPILPMSLISEQHQDNINIPWYPPEERFRFGEIYEANIMHLIHKYLEVDTYHRVVYVGPEKGSLAPLVEDHFCLTKPILSVFPGKVDYRDIEENHRLLAFKISHVGAEEFFAQATKDHAYDHAPFDRVIIHDSAQHFTDPQLTFTHVMKVLHKYGKILIIHRPGSLNTLPYFQQAKERICDGEVPYMRFISALQKIGADVEWDIVHVPIVMDTAKWLSMLKDKHPPQMEIMSHYEITCGIRELSEGPFKYLQGNKMELEDRLMFITASHPTMDCSYPAVQRVGGASKVPYSGLGDVKYCLPLTEEIQQFLPKSKTSQYKMKSIF
nr:uncharacterized protein LOC100180224 isoform X2 [Ciona intestinalis]|eukprot:XP_018670566.1 uncharacterized protein LOC100180224 isoform X2 [Ciona intestinalis]